MQFPSRTSHFCPRYLKKWLFIIAESCADSADLELSQAFLFLSSSVLSYCSLERVSHMLWPSCSQTGILTLFFCSVRSLSAFFSGSSWRSNAHTLLLSLESPQLEKHSSFAFLFFSGLQIKDASRSFFLYFNHYDYTWISEAKTLCILT